MIIINTIDNLVSLCSASNVASAAGVISGDWSNNHIFRDVRSYIGGINRGRLPIVNIYPSGEAASYDFQTADISGKGGTVTTTITIEIYSNRFERDVRTAYLIIEQIRNNIDGSWIFRDAEYTVNPPEQGPWGWISSITLTTNNSYAQ
jgi:hypothetical protein